MGILNITPNSFSDGGKFLHLDAAMQQAKKLAAEGADIIDVGAESTRPGHTPVEPEEELARLEPILGKLTSSSMYRSRSTRPKPRSRAAQQKSGPASSTMFGDCRRSRYGGHSRRNRRLERF